MLTVLKEFPNLVIIDSKYILDIDKMNQVWHEHLIKRGDLPPDDKTTRRVAREGKYVAIHAHGSLSSNELLKHTEGLLQADDLQYTVSDPDPSERTAYAHLLPTFSIMNNQYRGGTPMISDSRDTIDEGVRPICEAINKLEGISTFASCDGHGGARSFYFCYTAETMRDADRAVYYLRSCVDKYFPMLGVDMSRVRVSLKTEYMPDGEPTGIYFSFEILYYKSETEKIYEFSKLAAQEITKQLARGNTGVKAGKYYHYEPF